MRLFDRSIAFVALTVLACQTLLWANPWEKLAEDDLKAMYAIIVSTHPGMVDPENSGFKDQLESLYKEVYGKLDSVRSFEGHLAILKLFQAGFKDHHVGLSRLVVKKDVKWPEYLIRFKGNKFIVSYVADARNKQLPPLEAELISCDGLPPDKLMLARVFPYSSDSPDVEESWVENAPLLLIDNGNPWLLPLKECSFSHDGQMITLSNRWESIPLARFNALATPKGYEFSVADWEKNSVWISLPTFNPSTKSQVEALHKVVDAVANFRDKNLIVFDVRGNTGGNALWAEKILWNLYGEELFKWSQEQQPPFYAQYRVSSNAIELLEEAIETLSLQFQEAEIAIQRDLDALKEKLKAGVALYPEAPPPHTNQAKTPSPPNPVTGRVILVTDSSCGSSCLHFVDWALNLPGVIHVGLPTGADGSPYTQPAFVTLPSGLYQFGCPTKVRRNLPHPHQPYKPQYSFPGDIENTEALQKWIEATFG